MAIAAYFGGFAAREWDWPFVLILLVGIGIGAFVAFIPSLAIGKAPCFTVVIVGLTFIFIVKTIIENWELVGGTVGFFGIPPVEHLLPITYLLLIIVGFFIYRIDHSRLGRAASVVFVDKDVAATLGVNVKNLGMFYQIIAGAIGGMTGVLYAFLIGSLFPEFFGFHIIGALMCMLFVGGYTTMWGVVISVPILGGLPLLLPSAVASWRQVIYGVLLILIILFRPEGLISKRMLSTLKRKNKWQTAGNMGKSESRLSKELGKE
jgi:branched-chain amino acid transport system permease protein